MACDYFIAGDDAPALLRELIELAAQAVSPQIDGFTTRLADVLHDSASTAVNAEEARLRRSAAELLKKNRYPFYYVVASRVAAALAREASVLESAQGSGDLPTLPPDLEIDRKLCLATAGQALEREHAERLVALNLRLGAALGLHDLDTARNPFRPNVFLLALHEAWLEFQPDAAAHRLIYPLLGPRLCPDLGPMLHVLNTTLAKRGIALAPARVPEAAPGTLCDAAPPDDPLLQQLRRLFPPPPEAGDRPLAGAFPSLFQDEVLQASHARRDLLDLLARMQDRMPAPDPDALQRALADIGLSAADDAAIRLVARIFECIAANAHLAEQLKNAILSLHLPVLRCAMEDHDFFFRDAHPARRTVELLLRLAPGWDRRMGETDPLYPLFMRSIRRIMAESERHRGVFAEVALELEAFIQREQTATEQVLAAPIAQALKEEKRLQARRAARQQIRLRTDSGEVAPFVESFLEEKWVAVLTLAYVARDEKPQAVDSALRTMDELVWSVKPKTTADDRRELLGRLPPMIAMLNKWLDLVKWTGDGRARFFAELARCHASLVRAPVDMSPQRQLELAVEAAQQAAQRREQRRAAQQPEAPPDTFDTTVAGLHSGDWIAFSNGEAALNRLKLAWVSPMRNLYLFATRDRKEALTMQAGQLAQALRERRAQLIPAVGLVGHALAGALGAVSANQAGAVAA